MQALVHNARPLSAVERAIFLVLLTSAAFTFSLRSTEPDLWGHVQYGRDALAEGLHRTTTYSFTAEGHPWINHEILSELLFASCVDRWGVWSLLLGKCLLGTTIAGWIMYRGVRAGLPVPAAGGGTLLVCMNLIGFWHARPQVLSYFLFAGLLALLSFAFRDWQHRWHLPAPIWQRNQPTASDAPASLDARRLWSLGLAAPLFALWINTHGGFLAGVAVFCAYLGLRSVEVLFASSRNTFPPRWSVVRQLTLLTAVALLATLANPYGFEIHRWLFQSLTIPRPEIVEWHGLRPGDEPFPAFALLTVVTVGGLLFSRRPLDLTHTIVLALVMWQSILHRRHIPFFAIACGFWMLPHWYSAALRFRRNSQPKESPQATETTQATKSPWPVVGLVGLACFLWIGIFWRCQSLPVEKSTYPVSAISFAEREGLGGRWVVTYNWAQYVIAALGTDSRGDQAVRVGFDGRFRTCYPLDLVDQHFDFILGNHPRMPRHRSPSSGEPNPAAILSRGNPDIVLICRKQPNSVHVMENHSDQWTLLYQDQLAQLWGRKSVYDDPLHPRFFSSDRRSITDREQNGSVAWPATPTGNAHENSRSQLAFRLSPQP